MTARPSRLTRAWGGGIVAAMVTLGLWVAPALGHTASRAEVPAPPATATPDADGWVQLDAGAVDYAPMGLPDFDQRQTSWRVSGPVRQAWTHDGPVALAGALWWLDSHYEPAPVPPSEPHDGFDLLQALGPWDDHGPANVIPFVNVLASMARTDGPQGLTAVGTCMDDLASAAERVVHGSAERQRFTTHVTEHPTLQQLRDPISLARPEVLLIGIWQHHPLVGWQRLGGHFVGLAGIDAGLGRARIADPYLDVTIPPETPSAHNDAQLVSYDAYMVSPSLQPGPVLRLDGYLDATGDVAAFIGNFHGLNSRSCDEGDTAWLDGAELEAHIDAALTFDPLVPATDTPTLTPSPTATATPTLSATITAALPITATATLTATLTATVPPTDIPTAAPTDTATPQPTATLLPTAVPPSDTPIPTPTPTTVDTDTPQPPSTASEVPTNTPAASPTAARGDVCGRIVDGSSGVAVAGVSVALIQSGQVRQQDRSGASGQFCFLDVPSGDYILQARRDGCATPDRPVTIAGGLLRVDLTLTCHVRDVYLPLLMVQRTRARTP
jgi:hypothetical protein